MATKRSRGTIQNIVDAISELMRQPLSDESNEVPTADAVRRSKRVAAGPRPKARKVKAKKAQAKKPKATKASRKKKR